MSSTIRPRTRRAVLAVAVAVSAVLTAASCSTGPDGPLPAPAPPKASSAEVVTVPADSEPTTAPVSADPVITRIDDEQWALIVETGTWRPGCPVGRKSLRRLDINYVDFQGTITRGALVAHRDSVRDLAEIFTEIFDAGFPIALMEPVELFDGDVNTSLQANNTSAFNCRRPGQINAPVKASPHANGRAIDINPYQNPWQDPRCTCWVPSADYGPVRKGPGVITKGSLVWDLFTERGWIWQNIKVPDYMHFDTGYPSRPRPA